MVRCKARKKEATCNKDGMCSWNGTSCQDDSYETFLHICKSKRGKANLVEFAQRMNIDIKKKTIPQLCATMTEHLGKLHTNQRREARFIFNDIIRNTVPAPIIEPNQVAHLERISTASTGSISSLLKFTMSVRLRFHRHVTSVLKTVKSDELCTLSGTVQKIHRIGTPSINGEAFIVTAPYRNDKMVFAVKRMPSNKNNKGEIKLLDKFTKLVLDNENPHFPIAYSSASCKKCKYENPDLRYKNKSCLLCFNELANGDLKTFLRDSIVVSTDTFISMFCQVILGLVGLENAKLIHRDLHWGNILYHSVDSHTDMYSHYKFGNDNVYVKNTGQHWVLWDFGEVVRARHESDSLLVDVRRISNVSYWAMDEFARPLNSYLTIMLNNIRGFVFIPRMKCKDLLKYIYDMTKTSSDVLLINPQTKPAKIINRRPYMISKSSL